MARRSTTSGPAPGSAEDLVQRCGAEGACLQLQVRVRRGPEDTPVLANTQVTVTVGEDSSQAQTDAHGYVTLAYDAAADFTGQNVTVSVPAATLVAPGVIVVPEELRWSVQRACAEAQVDGQVHALGAVLVDPAVYLVLELRRAQGHDDTPLVTDTEVTLQRGEAQSTPRTNDQGKITYAYARAEDFANTVVKARIPGWWTQRNTNDAQVAGNVRTLALLLARVFTLKVTVTTHKPGTGALRWRHGWTANPLSLGYHYNGGAQQAIPFVSNGADPALATLSNTALLCGPSHVAYPRMHGVLTTTIRLTIDDGEPVEATADEQTSNGVTFRKIDGHKLRLVVTRAGAVVTADFEVAFAKVLVVGEGTYFEYATGLARKFGDAGVAPGFKWVVATQYDVTDVADVPDDMTVLATDTGAEQANVDQHQRVTDASDKNLVIRGAQFDATDAACWAAALLAYGEFDAVVFNNPHPGYGMHMCAVMGLTTAHPFRDKNGKGISVYSIGYGPTLTDPQRNEFVNDRHKARVTQHRRFVRTDDASCLNYQNARDTALACQFSTANSSPQAVTVTSGFVYREDGGDLGATYGGAHEFDGFDVYQHYRSRLNTVGLHEYLLRAYRYHGPSVLKRGGYLMVNGSQHYNGTLTAGFTFRVAMVDHVVAGMTNHCAWTGYADTFVYYRTNFTSTLHHPSWYAPGQFNPGEPNLDNARCYRWQKP